MKKLIAFLMLVLIGLNVSGQINPYGVPIIRNYVTQITHGADQNWCMTSDIFGNIYFGNQDKGVIRYDGTKWAAIKIGNNPRIFSLASDSRGIIYVGAAFEFGYLQPDTTGKTEYISLASRIDSIPEIKVVFSIVVQENKVLFLTEKFIYVYNVNEDSLSKIRLSKFNVNDAFRLVKINDKLILSDNLKGLYQLNDTVVSPLPGGDSFKNMSCTVLLPFDESKILIGTFYDGLFLYDYKTGDVNKKFIDNKINEKLKEVSIYAAAKLDDQLFAVGTTNQEGVLIFNRQGKLIQQIRKENSRLEDNTIFALYCDTERNSELWISTYGFISKAYFNIPITEFTEKQGIESGINEICEFNNHIYLSSDAGVLKSTYDKSGNIVFKKIEGINTQVFPLEVIKSSSGDVLLAGSLNGIVQISKDDQVTKLESICDNVPGNLSHKLNALKILQSAINPEMVYVGLGTGSILSFKFNGTQWKYIERIRKVRGLLSGIVEKNDGGLWFFTDDPSDMYSFNIAGSDTIITKYGSERGVNDVNLNSIIIYNDELYIASSGGILKYDKSADRFVNDNNLTQGYSEGKNSRNLFFDNDGDMWYSATDDSSVELLFRKTGNTTECYKGVLSLLPDYSMLDIMHSDDKIYMIKSKTLFVVDKSKLKPDSLTINTSFVKISVGSDSVVMNGSFYKTEDHNVRIPWLSNTSTSIPEFDYDLNDLLFEWTTPNFTEELLTEYSYRLDGFENEWSKWEGISYASTLEAQYPHKEYTNLPYGHYTFRVKTRTLTGLTGNELSYEFIILKPWYATVLAFLGFVIVSFLIVYLIIKAYTRKLKNENIRLEGIVAERTAIVVKQKEELESSIHYASRIQLALLPSEAILSDNIRNYFVLFKPRDIVSGDFYWMMKKGERLYVVAADCTGHGVPGAFMSLLGMSFLDEIIDKETAPRADYILKELRLHVTESLKQVGGDDEAKDGMDIGLLVIDFNTRKIEFSGAYNPCFRVRKLTSDELKKYNDDSIEMADGSMSNGKYLLETIFASKMPIGISSKMNEEFVFNEWSLEKGISYYMFSDGYIDQFGGPKGRKFMKKSFKRLILDIQDYPMSKQKELLDDNIKLWMKNYPQIDDILVMGIRPE